MPRPFPPSSPLPYQLGPPQSARRAIVLHGYSGSAYEMRPLAEALAEAGFHARGLLLPGHGTQPLELARITADRLLAHAHQALLEESADVPVTLVGLSTGALIQAVLAAQFPERVRSLVLLAPALKLYPKGQAAILAARLGLGRLRPTVPKETPGGDCGDPEGRAHNTGYPVITLGGLPALGDLQNAAARALGRVRAPTLVIHGDADLTVPAWVGADVARRLTGAARVEHLRLPRSRHLLPLDVERDEVCARVCAFAAGA